MKLSKRWMVILGGILIIVVIGSLAIGGGGISVDTVEVRRAPMEVGIRTDGYTQVVHPYTLTAPVSGELERIVLEEGDPIEEGQVLARILPSMGSEQTRQVAEAGLEAAKARIAQAELALLDATELAHQASTEVARRESLAEQDIISAEMLEQARLAADSATRQKAAADAALKAAAADVRSAEAMLMNYGNASRENAAFEVLSPITGNVLRIADENARAVMTGTPLFEVGDVNDMELTVDVLSEDAVQISSGDQVHVTGWGGSTAIEGRVRLVEPFAYTKISTLGVEEQRVNVKIDLDDVPDGLGVGFRAEASIVIWTSDDALSIPVSAAFQQEGVWFTFLVEDGAIEQRQLEVGERSATHVQILSGVGAGDEVVIFPGQDVVDGATVR